MPLIIAFVVLQFIPFQDLWEAIFPFLDEPDKYSLNEVLDSEERKEALEGVWQVFVLFVVLGIFNTIIGLVDLTDAILGAEDDIDEALNDIELKHTYTPTLTEGRAQIDGVP